MVMRTSIVWNKMALTVTLYILIVLLRDWLNLSCKERDFTRKKMIPKLWPHKEGWHVITQMLAITDFSPEITWLVARILNYLPLMSFIWNRRNCFVSHISFYIWYIQEGNWLRKEEKWENEGRKEKHEKKKKKKKEKKRNVDHVT